MPAKRAKAKARRNAPRDARLIEKYLSQRPFALETSTGETQENDAPEKKNKSADAYCRILHLSSADYHPTSKESKAGIRH
jgi:hypothetical protein